MPMQQSIIVELAIKSILEPPYCFFSRSVQATSGASSFVESIAFGIDDASSHMAINFNWFD